jgi:hypothetical protein
MKKQLFLLLIILSTTTHLHAATFTWHGTTSSDFNTASNWSGGGTIPDSADHILISSSATNNLVLDQNRKITNLTLSSKTIDLNGYSLTVYGTATMTSGTVTNGTFYARGNLAAFNGTLMDCPVDADCGYIRFSGSTFNSTVTATDQGVATGTGAGGCTFNDDVTIIHGGNGTYFTLANTTGDVFNADLTVINYSSHEVHLSNTSSTQYKGNLMLSSTGTGGITFGNSGGTSTLDSGKTITIGSTGFTNDVLLLKNFTQLGNTAQTLTLTGTAVASFNGSTFNGEITVSSPGILLKNSTFNGMSSFTKTGTSNAQSDGGNVFNSATTISNTAASGRIRMATVSGDTYNADATFNSTGQDVQIAYSGNNIFAGNITINSNKVVFNTSTGKVTFTGTNNQTLNGSYNYPFKKLAINKTVGTVTANTNLSVDDSLIFIQGNLITTSTNLLTMKHGSTAIGASNNSFVSGPVKKVGNAAFWFPVGCFNTYQPMAISAPGTTNAAFIGQYMVDSIQVNTGNRDTTLGYIYRDRYWNLSRETGSSDVYVTLSWQDNQPIIDSNIVVVSWNGTKWIDIGKNQIIGSKLNGNTQSSVVATSYNEFSIGYSIANKPPSNCDCNDVQTAKCLEDCLYFYGPAPWTVSITDDIELIPDQATWSGSLPMPIKDGVILQGMTSGVVSKWWEADCPLIITDHVGMFPNSAGLYLFTMETGATIDGLRIRGPHCNYKDFNAANELSGGIYIVNEPSATTATINNTEISGFSQSGVWKTNLPLILNLNNCYIHKIKGRTSSGIGYGVWTLGDVGNDQEIYFNNCIFDDCKAAIDGQGDPISWYISKTTFSQFFISEDINKHNYNKFKLGTCPCTGSGNSLPSDHTFYDYEFAGAFEYYGNYWDQTKQCIAELPSCNPPGHLTFPGPGFGSITETFIQTYYDTNFGVTLTGIPFYDIGGNNTLIENCIFHKKWKLGQNGNINLNYPNRDVGNHGHDANKIEIKNNTFATDLFEKQLVLQNYNNNSGYAKISDNYIEADIWSNDVDHIKKSNNHFGYKSGDLVSGSPTQPHDVQLNLKQSGTILNSTHNMSSSSGSNFIQYIDAGTMFDLELQLLNASSQSQPRYIIRPNLNSGVSLSTEILSSNNYYYDDEVNVSGSFASHPLSYTHPGLYGIDVLGFDVNDYGTNDYNFKASSWKHIPIIVKSVEEQVIYFNIKDSYHGLAAGIKKSLYLNDTKIWEEDISADDKGWQYVKIDLKGSIPGTSTPILHLINFDGSKNSIAFGIEIDPNVSTNDIAGVYVWVDDIYFPVPASITADNLIADGTIELSNDGICTDCYWSNKISPANLTSGTVATGISSIDRRSGEKGIYMYVPFIKNVNLNAGSNQISAARVGTNFDFTDLLSCSDYDTPVFIAFPCSTCTTQTLTDKKYKVGNDITIGSSQELVLEGCHLAIEPEVKITVANGGTLIILNDGANNSHLFPCSDMWNGIIVEPGGILDIGGTVTSGSKLGTLIQGAITAIDVNAGTLKLNYATFDHDLLSVYVRNNPSVNSYIYGCKFRCTGARIGKAPFDDYIPFEHVRIENVSNFQFPIGKTTGGTGLINYFSDAFSAIGVYKSSVIIQRNNFDDIYNHNSFYHSSSYGQAINVVGSPSTTPLVVDIGGTGTNEPNYFTNSNIGVRVSNTKSISQLVIAGNEFENTSLQEIGAGTDFCNTAITVQNPLSRLITQEVSVFGNTITDYRIGIHANNVSAISIGADVTGGTKNTINLNKGYSGFMHGIWIENCPQAKIQSNEITQNGVTYSAEGITINESADILKDLSIPSHVFGNCEDTEFHCNEFDNQINTGSTGILLNNAILKHQGIDPADIPDGQTWDNEWFGYSGSNNGVTGIANQPFTWYYDVAQSSFDPNPDPSTISSDGLTNPNHFGCSVLVANDEPDRDLRFSALVHDTLYFENYTSEFEYKQTEYLYSKIKNDTSLLTRNTSIDSLFSRFYNEIQLTNLGLFIKVDSLIIAGSLDQASDLNMSVVDSTLIETNLKSVNAILINKVLRDSLLSIADSTALEAIAIQNPLTGGKAVYMARAILFMEMHYETEVARFGNQTTSNLPVNIPESSGYLELFPNPSKERCFIGVHGIAEHLIMQVRSSIGQLVLESEIPNSGLEINTSTFNPGIYFVFVKGSEEFSQLLKLVILR